MAARDHWADLRREMERIFGWVPGSLDPDPLDVFGAIKKDADRLLKVFEAGRDGRWPAHEKDTKAQ